MNVVVMRGQNDDEIADFVELTRHQALNVRFIEYMPFDGNVWSNEKLVPYRAMQQAVQAAFPQVTWHTFPGQGEGYSGMHFLGSSGCGRNLQLGMQSHVAFYRILVTGMFTLAVLKTETPFPPACLWLESLTLHWHTDSTVLLVCHDDLPQLASGYGGVIRMGSCACSCGTGPCWYASLPSPLRAPAGA